MDAVDALIDLDVTINDNEIYDQILERIDRDFKLTDFIFFQSIKNNSDDHCLRLDIQIYVKFSLFKMKHRKKCENSKLNISKHSTNLKQGYQCDFCNKSGHTSDYCYSNPKSKKHKDSKREYERTTKKPNIQLHTASPTSIRRHKLRDQTFVDSGATDHLFCDEKIFDSESLHSSSLECGPKNLAITGIGTLNIKQHAQSSLLKISFLYRT